MKSNNDKSKITSKFKHTTKLKQHLAYCRHQTTTRKIQIIDDIDNINTNSDCCQGRIQEEHPGLKCKVMQNGRELLYIKIMSVGWTFVSFT